ncbi:LOW QUALITY PROTEIN: hypothetical protein TorRG33x02_117460 [Trema orientale]|uniref:F-box associated domain n=1 Tax=Trema orientale TaxID=63057 RepID=A0A2P5F3S4_TREOI|nr:LOW QUALITY PROTEIN: hypothetical protein TorRG33x02_117460 [Trema orientale]
MFDSRVFWNGAVYWISRSETSLRFDIEEELLRETPMPLIPGGWEPSTVRYFGESHGHLNMINFYLPRRIEFDVYEIESDCSGWFMKYRVDLFGVLGAFPEMIRSYLDPLDMDYYGFILCLEEVEEFCILLVTPYASMSKMVVFSSFVILVVIRLGCKLRARWILGGLILFNT